MRYQNTKENKERNILRLKKVMACCLAFLIVFGLYAVDRSYQDMMGVDEGIMPQIVLEADGIIKITGFSDSLTINYGCVRDFFHL